MLRWLRWYGLFIWIGGCPPLLFGVYINEVEWWLFVCGTFFLLAFQNWEVVDETSKQYEELIEDFGKNGEA